LFSDYSGRLSLRVIALEGSLSSLPGAWKVAYEPKLVDVENTAFNAHFAPANEKCAGGVVFDASVSPLATGLIAGAFVALTLTRKGLTELRKLITELTRLVCELQKLSVSLKSIRNQKTDAANKPTSRSTKRKKDNQSAPVRDEVGQREALSNRSP
jgi:hypothetical protein